MAIPTDHKAVQARILDHARQVGWTFVPRAAATENHARAR